MASAPPKTNEYSKDVFDTQVICRYYLNGTCKFGKNCKFSHDLSIANQQICHFYKKGKCNNGSSCRFLHTNEETLKEKACNSKKPPVQISSGACAAFPEVTSWVEAAEFIPGKKYTPRCSDESYSSALKSGLPPQPKEENFCALAVEGECLNGDNCPLIHGLICDMCNLYLLHPTDKSQQDKHRQECLKYIEEDMKDSFKIATTNEMSCGICMEKVAEKATPSERRFGILENCMHVFCLECIRKWRCSDKFQKKVVKSCPECRVASAFVTPSIMWIEDAEEKSKMITSYKESLSRKPCKYFDQGRGKCPFAKYCFYLHAYPDGTKQDKSKLICKRAINKNGDIQDLQVHLSDILDGNDMLTYAMFSEMLNEDDEDMFDILLYDSSTYDSDDEFDFELEEGVASDFDDV